MCVQSPNDSMSAALSEETTELIAKLTQLQQENWALEEKVDMKGSVQYTEMPSVTFLAVFCTVF